MRQGRWKDAELLQIQVMEASKTQRGDEHPHTLLAMNNLAQTWKFQGRYSDAVALMETCLQLSHRIIGPNHPHTVSSQSALNDWKQEMSTPSDDRDTTVEEETRTSVK
jgi:hypothetical protein